MLKRTHAPLLALAVLVACAGKQPPPLTAHGRVFSEAWYENFAFHPSPESANCLAREVGSVSRQVGPLFGQRPDDTPGSVWRAVDLCLDNAAQGRTARALLLGGWGGEEPSLAEVWADADSVAARCVTAAGGWQTLGTFENLRAICRPAISDLTGHSTTGSER